jgi:hypothetical protein
MFSGHIGFGFCDEVAQDFERDAFIFAVLRNPVDRIVSYIDMMLDPTRHFFGRGESALYQGATLDGYLQVDRVISTSDLLNSTLARIIPGKVRALRKSLMKQGKIQATMLCHYNKTLVKTTMSDHQLLQCALKNLHRLDAVGITERLDDLVPILTTQLTVIPDSFKKWPRRNEARGNRTKISATSHQILQRYAAVDIAVYREAVKLSAIQHARAMECLSSPR